MNTNLDELACLPIGMAYVPVQCYGDLYDEATALARGTLFRALDLPFEGRANS